MKFYYKFWKFALSFLRLIFLASSMYFNVTYFIQHEDVNLQDHLENALNNATFTLEFPEFVNTTRLKIVYVTFHAAGFVYNARILLAIPTIIFTYFFMGIVYFFTCCFCCSPLAKSCCNSAANLLYNLLSGTPDFIWFRRLRACCACGLKFTHISDIIRYWVYLFSVPIIGYYFHFEFEDHMSIWGVVLFYCFAIPFGIQMIMMIVEYRKARKVHGKISHIITYERQSSPKRPFF